MGTAKILNSNDNFRTHTIIGTPHYMAPEIITGRGYTYSTDFYTIGIILFEFLVG